MKPNSAPVSHPTDNCRIPWRLIYSVSSTLFLLLFISRYATAQYTCADYCNQGYANWVVTDSNYFCFSVSAGDTNNVCLESVLNFNSGAPGCDPNATVLVGVYPLQQNCVSPLEYSFTAGNGINITPCPNGTSVHCCCLPPGNYYMRILSGGADYSQCFTGHVKVCLNCSHGNCP